MKNITNWKDLNGLENDKGLYLEAYIKGNTKSHCECYIFDGINNLNLGIYPINNLEEIIYTLKKYGFDIEYGKPFKLVEFLRTSLEPKDFRYGEINFYFASDEHDYITMFNEEDYSTLNCRYFSKKIDDISCIEATLQAEKITTRQLKIALKQLGWI